MYMVTGCKPYAVYISINYIIAYIPCFVVLNY